MKKLIQIFYTTLFLVITFFVLAPNQVKADSVVLSTSSTIEEAARSGGDDSWSNLTYADGDDSNYANTTALSFGQTTQYLQATNWGASIPAGATIDGISVSIKAYASGSSVRTDDLLLVKAGSIVGTAQDGNASLSTSEGVDTFGNSTNLWGTTWDATDINNSGFGFVVSYYNGTFSSRYPHVNDIYITIYYTPIAGDPPNTPSLDLPTNTATDQSTKPILKTTATDLDSDYLRYKIELCTDAEMTQNCQTFDQTSDQTGWSGQDAETSTAYASGTQATYTIQSALNGYTPYYWRSYAIDPGGNNTWSSTQTAYSFATGPSECTVPVSGNLTLQDESCAFPTTENGINGIDAGTGSTNTAVLTMGSNSVLTIRDGQTIATGSISLTGGTITIVDGGIIKPGAAIYTTDADNDNYPGADMSLLYLADGTNIARRSASVDCNDSDGAKYQNISGYTDSDGDGHGTGSAQDVCSGPTIASGYTTTNNTDCNDTGTNSSNVYTTTSCYVDGDEDGYGSTTEKTCTNNATCASATWASGGEGTAAATTKLVATNTDCNDSVYSTANTCGPTRYGDGHDGSINLAANKNINTDAIASGRSKADGEAFKVSAISTNTVTVTGTGTDGTASTSVGTSIAANNEVILINLQGDNTNSNNVGNYEFFLVASVSSNQLTFTENVTKIYGATSSNSTLTGQKIILQRVPNYTTVEVPNTRTLTASAWSNSAALGGVLVFKATTSLTVGSTGSITTSNLGYDGGDAWAGDGNDTGEGGESFCGIGGYPPGGSGAAGAGAYATEAAGGPGVGGTGYCGGGGQGGNANAGTGSASKGGAGGGGTAYGGGAGGGYGTGGYRLQTSDQAGTNSSQNGQKGWYVSGGAGGSYGAADLSKILFGSGGGMGGNIDGYAHPNPGGNGGGIIYIAAPSLSISGTITSNGQAGGNAVETAAKSGGSGGGAGGSIKLIVGSSAALGTNRFTATGGTYGTQAVDCSDNYCNHGGTGGAGRIRVEYEGTAPSGSTSPTMSSAQQ